MLKRLDAPKSSCPMLGAEMGGSSISATPEFPWTGLYRGCEIKPDREPAIDLAVNVSTVSTQPAKGTDITWL